MIETLSDMAGQCDGIRCDMAMLLLNNIFERTWGERAGIKPGEDYWRALIPAIKTKWPEFRFMAEAYWDLEWELQQQGFDFCYDKKLYDRMEHGEAENVRLHLWRIFLTRRGWSGSSRTMTSPGPLPCSHLRRRGQQRFSLQRCQGQSYFTKASLREER